MAASLVGHIRTRDGERLVVQRLTPAYARRHTKALLAIHDQIPHVRWSPAELLAEDEERALAHDARWQMSAVVRRGREPVALLIAYLRGADDRHPLESAYAHRLAVRKDWQRRGVGSALMKLAVSWYFTSLPWLLTVTTQTNDEPGNSGVLEFYEKLAFRRSYPVLYPDKRDVLLEFDRARWIARPGEDVSVAIKTSGTPFDARPTWGVPQVYFGTSSIEKLTQYQHLMRCYGLGLRRLRPTVSLTEPQVEGYDRTSEAALVAEPLKWFSRFAANAGTYPVVIEDTMLFIELFNTGWPERAILPGADTKRWWQALESEGLLALMEGSRRRRARYVCQLGVNAGPGIYRTFRTELSGSIARAITAPDPAADRFPLTNGTFFHSVFVPAGEERTLAQLAPEDFLAHDYRRRCVAAAAGFLHKCAARPAQVELFGDPGW
jgi:inosine/xanthosine triphosphate pyrophosphatase family protein/GNAT superfamily N-acetyltransferase